jgi:hypothetical protein
MGSSKSGMLRQQCARGLALFALAASAACAGESNKSSNAPAASGGSGESTTPPAAIAAPNRCPLTAEQVTAAVGSPMKQPDSSCGFFPVNDKILPHVLFVLQVNFACNGTMPAEVGFKEKVDGLGVTAYVADWADGTHLLVCRENSPFDISVDLADDAKARTAAMTLARQVLAGS